MFILQMYTPLHAAASSGQVSVVKLLLEMGAEVDAVNCFGNTALHVACHNGQDVVVTELLGYGAAINAVNNMGLVSDIQAFSSCIQLYMFQTLISQSIRFTLISYVFLHFSLCYLN